MRRGWFSVWSAFAIILALSGAPLHAQFAYVANFSNSNLSGYTINPATGVLTAIAGSPFSAGAEPDWVVVDPSGKFLYVAHLAVRNVVFGFTINQPTEPLTSIVASPTSAGNAPTSSDTY